MTLDGARQKHHLVCIGRLEDLPLRRNGRCLRPTNEEDPMPLRALVVVESAFGNTDRIARALAEGLASAGVDGTVAAASAAPDAPAAEGFGLVVVGAFSYLDGVM